MSNPQLENGFVRIANELWDALAATRIPGQAMQILMVIITKTYGFNKKVDAISLSQFSKLTGMKKTAIVRGIRKLQSMNLIIIKKDNPTANTYSINKSYRNWKPLPKKITGFVKKSSMLPLCYICGFGDAIEKHHIKPLSENGRDVIANKIHLCPNCHTLTHKGKYDKKYLISLKDKTEKSNKEDNPKFEKVKKGLSKKGHTIDTITKDTLTIDKGKRKTFKIPELKEVQAYCLERGNTVDYEKWHDFYTSKGWMVGKNKMKDWKACVRTWEKNNSGKGVFDEGEYIKSRYDKALLEDSSDEKE